MEDTTIAPRIMPPPPMAGDERDSLKMRNAARAANKGSVAQMTAVRLADTCGCAQDSMAKEPPVARQPVMKMPEIRAGVPRRYKPLALTRSSGTNAHDTSVPTAIWPNASASGASGACVQ